MLVDYNAKNLFYYRDFRFVPKTNVVPKDLWEEMKKNPVIKNKIKMKIFVEHNEVLEGVEEDFDLSLSIVELKLADAKSLVESTFDIIQLEKWLNTETRKGVLKAIEQKIEELTAHHKS